MIRDQIKNELEKVAREAGFDKIELEVLPTTDPKFGDYYSSVALKIAQVQGKQKPVEIAKQIVAKLPKSDDVFTVEIAPNGFINVTLTAGFLQSQAQKIIEQNESYGRNEIGKGKKARVEFVSANPTGPLHIGNARGGPLGDTIASVLEFAGYKVLREYINNDKGNQVFELGKSLAAKAGLIDASDKELTYVGGYTDDLSQEVKKELNKDKNLPEDQIVMKAGEIGTRLMHKDIINDISDAGIKFDLVVNESELQKKLPPALKLLEEKGLLKEQGGATWFLLGEGFDERRDAVVIKSDGSYTYFGADIVYHKEKFESGYDLILDVFGSNTSGHVPKIEAIVSAFGFDASKLKVILYQFVRVKRGEQVIKMSKRAGNFVTAKEVLDEVGKDAFRFTLLMYDSNTHMDFDLEQAKKQSEENPVYYVQYAHARVSSILKKAKQEGFSLENLVKADLKLLKTNSEIALIRKLVKFPELIEDIVGSESYPVHLLPLNTLKIADELNRFYERTRVLGEEKETTEARLALMMTTKIVLANSLQLMGISAPEHM
ncbi:MAG: arginine--tRNA ligase [Candidatus Woykebacteria bacterium]